jgi:hypothetical protein
MRSEYVFAASKKIGNRFMLCRMTSISARRLHKGSTHASETINMSLKLIGANEDSSSIAVVASVAPVDPVQAEVVVAEA